MRVAFTLVGGKNWTGGHNYLLNLLHAIDTYASDRVEPVLFVDSAVKTEDVAAFETISCVTVVRTALLNAGRRPRSVAQSIILGKDFAWEKLLLEHRINMVFEVAHFFGWRLKVPAVAWMPDFQHKYLPQLFSRGAWWKREIGSLAQIWGGRDIMVSSEDARQACEKFYPSTRGRIHTVHFAVPPGADLGYEEARAVADKYGLPEHFFFMPNQFWKHKNHNLVLDALALLKAQGHHVVVAASGRQLDTRDANHFPNFMKRLDELGLADEFRVLGLISYHDLLGLMRAGSALLNASLFEGWSTTVEEARSLGAPMVLSDLDVHKEQVGTGATYFDRYDPQSLASALLSFKPLTRAEREERVKEARTQAFVRVKQFANDFAGLVERCGSPRLKK
ncbi:glycosyltransferase family 4 protein [Achromobacter dolens]|uniref:glycosyltransferase family 4 protein n=1 Tax=Achromobacter dolens TaxID=1287738 RepID=UPI003558DE59